jgi:photosystem II stability/assembly factor-like uncharacterized protein
MTPEQAAAKARARWGRTGVALRVDDLCCVGHALGGVFLCRGTGATWSEAFEDADRYESTPPA